MEVDRLCSAFKTMGRDLTSNHSMKFGGVTQLLRSFCNVKMVCLHMKINMPCPLIQYSWALCPRSLVLVSRA